MMTNTTVEEAARGAHASGLDSESTRVNVGDAERLASALGGTALVVYGLSQRSLLGTLWAGLGGALVYRGASGHCAGYQLLGINTAGRRGIMTSVPAGAGIKAERSITINRPREEVYRFWRDLENLPHVMQHLASVERMEGNRFHWVARGPLGRQLEWDAEIHHEKPNEVLAWRSLPGSEVDTAGSVHFKPTPRGDGTEIRVTFKYDPPGGKPADWLASLFGKDVASDIEEDLRRLKQLLETGEIATTEGQPSGTCTC